MREKAKYTLVQFFSVESIRLFDALTVVSLSPSRKHHREVKEVNNLPTHSIQSICWIKPIIRQHAGQMHAHAVITVTSAEITNLIIKDGITIHGARPKAEKTKQKLIQCLKCRKWEHKAQDCTETSDMCGTCGGDHCTNACDSKCYAL